MASDNVRHFEVRLRKLGLFMLICGMSGLLFAAFLFGVVVGSDLETFPGKISRQVPVRFLEWAGLLDAEKPQPVAVVIKSEKTVPKEEATPPGMMVRNIPLPSVPSAEMNPARGNGSFPEPEQVKVPPLPVLQQRGKAHEEPSAKQEDKDKGKETEDETYLVQVTSCKSKKIAEEVVRKIAKAGFKSQIVTAELKDKGTWYRVLLTNFGNKEKAKEAARKIDQVLKGNKSVVRVQKG